MPDHPHVIIGSREATGEWLPAASVPCIYGWSPIPPASFTYWSPVRRVFVRVASVE